MLIADFLHHGRQAIRSLPVHEDGWSKLDEAIDDRSAEGIITVAAPASIRLLSVQMLAPTMYVAMSGSGVIFRKQIRVSPRR